MLLAPMVGPIPFYAMLKQTIYVKRISTELQDVVDALMERARQRALREEELVLRALKKREQGY